MYKEKKERERKEKRRKISLPEDPAVRLDCCNFNVQSDQSDCHSLDLLRVRESTQNTKFNGLINSDLCGNTQVPPLVEEFYTVCCSTGDLLQHFGFCAKIQKSCGGRPQK